MANDRLHWVVLVIVAVGRTLLHHLLDGCIRTAAFGSATTLEMAMLMLRSIPMFDNDSIVVGVAQKCDGVVRVAMEWPLVAYDQLRQANV